MPRYYARTFESSRHRTPLPPERRAEQPFVYLPQSRRIIAPWPEMKCALPADDQARLEQVVERIEAQRPTAPVWIWPHRDPVAIAVERSWLMNWARDRACYSITDAGC